MDASRQLKRLRQNNAGASSDNSDDEIEQVEVMLNMTVKKKPPVVKYPKLLYNIMSSLRQSAGFFLKSRRKV